MPSTLHSVAAASVDLVVMNVHDDDGVVRDSIGDGDGLDAALDELLVGEGRQLVRSKLLELHG
eukprot:3298655-Pyramimonas_sp.AAC.1